MKVVLKVTLEFDWLDEGLGPLAAGDPLWHRLKDAAVNMVENGLANGMDEDEFSFEIHNNGLDGIVLVGDWDIVVDD